MKIQLNGGIIFLIIMTLIMATVTYGQQNVWTRPPILEPAYGDLYLVDNIVPTTINTIDVWENITNKTVQVSANVNLIQLQDDPEPVPQIRLAGVYLAMYSVSLTNKPNIEYQTTMGINSVPQVNCQASRKLGASSDVGNLGSQCFLELQAGDQLSVMIRNVDNNQDPTIVKGNVALLRIDD